jgi:hypothetical protein
MNQQEIDQMHYLPANNMMPSYLMGGVAGVRKAAAEYAAEMRQQIRQKYPNDPIWPRWVDWYEKTCLEIANRLERREAGLPAADPKKYAPFRP